MTINELQKKFPSIDWLEYLNKVLFPQPRLKDTDEVITNNGSYLENFFQLIEKTPKRDIANYVFWRFFEFSTNLLSSRIRKAETEFLNELKGRNFRDYEADCVSELMAKFPVAMDMLYVNKHFDVKKKDFALNMLEDIRISIRKILGDVSMILLFENFYETSVHF